MYLVKILNIHSDIQTAAVATNHHLIEILLGTKVWQLHALFHRYNIENMGVTWG